MPAGWLIIILALINIRLRRPSIQILIRLLIVISGAGASAVVVVVAVLIIRLLLAIKQHIISSILVVVVGVVVHDFGLGLIEKCADEARRLVQIHAASVTGDVGACHGILIHGPSHRLTALKQPSRRKPVIIITQIRV